MKWRAALIWSAAVDASLFAAIGIHDIDRESIAFAALYLVGLALLRVGRRGIVGVVLIGLLSLDTEFWMVPATISNLQNGAPLLGVLQPMSVATVTLVALIATAGTLITRDRRPGNRLPIVAAGALGVFLVAFLAEAQLAGATPQLSGGPVVLRVHNAAYSTRSLDLGSNQGSVLVVNQDLFWHTFTIDKLGINVLIPGGGQRQVRLQAPSGTYTFYCAIPGHRQAGMQGTLTVGP